MMSTGNIKDIISKNTGTEADRIAAHNEFNAFMNQWALSVEISGGHLEDPTIIGDMKKIEALARLRTDTLARLAISGNKLGLESREAVIDFASNTAAILEEETNMLPPEIEEAIAQTGHVVLFAPEATLERMKEVISEQETKEHELFIDLAKDMAGPETEEHTTDSLEAEEEGSLKTAVRTIGKSAVENSSKPESSEDYFNKEGFLVAA